MVNEFDYADIKLPFYKKDCYKIEQNNSICLMYFIMKIVLFILFIY